MKMRLYMFLNYFYDITRPIVSGHSTLIGHLMYSLFKLANMPTHYESFVMKLLFLIRVLHGILRGD
jgi:hypothetical protein